MLYQKLEENHALQRKVSSQEQLSQQMMVVMLNGQQAGTPPNAL